MYPEERNLYLHRREQLKSHTEWDSFTSETGVKTEMIITYAFKPNDVKVTVMFCLTPLFSGDKIVVVSAGSDPVAGVHNGSLFPEWSRRDASKLQGRVGSPRDDSRHPGCAL